MPALALALAGCAVEHYQILPDWTGDESADVFEEGMADVPGEESVADIRDVPDEPDAEDEEDDGGPPACREPSDDGDLLCEPGFVCCENGDTDYCFDLSADPDNCGACGHGCDSGLECVGGTCIEI